jgi:signal transduction protein with GAF and PtsI domain
MICRASTGVAPDLGVSLRSGFGLAGQCLCTGGIVQTSDARSDSRVDTSVARQLQLGSAVILPICDPGKLAGVLGVFSRHPRAFDNFHIQRLERLAAVIATALEIPAVAPPEAELKPARPDESRLEPNLLTSKALASAAPGHPLHRLESLWNLIETAHYRRRSSGPIH